MPVCTGRGDVDSGHCCWVNGEVCAYLDESGEVPRCKLWGKMDSPQYKRSKAGKYFAERYPGFTCEDWPQNIPEVMAAGVGLCCWGDN